MNERLTEVVANEHFIYSTLFQVFHVVLDVFVINEMYMWFQKSDATATCRRASQLATCASRKVSDVFRISSPTLTSPKQATAV